MKPRLKLFLALSTFVFAAACSKFASPSIIGHWRAERVQVFSAQLPVGPDIVISDTAISSPGTDVSMPVNGFDAKSGQVTVDTGYGVGVTFYFDGPDRVYLKLPIVGRIYYRRVQDEAVAANAVASNPVVVQQTVSAVPGNRGGQQPSIEASANDGRSAAEYQMAAIAAKQGQSDAALDHLNNAFKAGFRDYARLDASPEFASLGNDVRYQALLARYR